jgi:hypothetical protein
MASMHGLEDRAEGVARELHFEPPRCRAPIQIFLGVTAMTMILVVAFLAGYRLASAWSALAILSWMFVAGAARASSD